jgi:hypothetical protein
MEYAYPFICGFIATLTFHQGTLFVLHRAGLWPKPAFAMAATKPFHVPAVISLAAWGGVWGIFLWYLVRGMTGPQYWMYATAFGALAPSVVALFVVFPLKGLPVAGGGSPKVILPVLLLNGMWGLGVAVLMRVFTRLF